MPRFPRPRRPSLEDAGYEARRRGRRFRYFVEDVGYAGRRAPVRLGAQIKDLWLDVSPDIRRWVAWAAGIAALAALLWLALIPNLPCQAPGGDRCPPSDEAIGLVPGDALAYAHANVDPDTDQYEQAAALERRVPTIAQALLSSLPGPGGRRIDYRRDVAPWLGGEAALALTTGKGGSGEGTFLLEAANQAAALDFADKEVVGHGAKRSKHNGVELRTARGAAAAMVGDFLVLGSKRGVFQVIDTQEGNGPSLADSKPANEVQNALPDDRLAEVYVSRQGARAVLAGPGRFSSLESFVDYRATLGAGAALVADDDAVEVDVHSVLDPKRQKRSPGFFGAFPPFKPTLASEASAGALAYLGIGNPDQTVKSLVVQASSAAPALAAGFAQLSAELRRLGKVNLQKQVLPLLGSEAAVTVEPFPESQPKQGSAGRGGKGRQGGGGGKAGGVSESEPGLPAAPPGAQAQGGATPQGVVQQTRTPYLSFVANDVDEQRAKDALARLQAPVAKTLSPSTDPQTAFDEHKIDGVEAPSLKVSPNVDLTYALFDGKLVISTDPEGVRQVRSGDERLDDSDLFSGATQGFPDAVSALVYLNVGELIQLAEQEGLATDPSYALFAGDIQKLGGFGLAVQRGAETIDTKARLTVGQ